MISLIMLGSIINYLTRSTLAVAAPTLLKELHISAQQYSWIIGAFQGAIMSQPICGYVLDVLGLKIGFAIFAIAWSLVNMAHSFAGSWQAFAWLRGLLGFAEGSANPAGMKATADWFPAKERGLAGGVYNIGASVGSMLAPPLVAWAILAYNWRVAFVITGSLGLVWVVLWLLLYQSPDRHPALSEQEKEFISSGQEKHLQSDGSRPSLVKILAQRNFWGIALPRFLADPTWGTLSFWLPLYLSTRPAHGSEADRLVRLDAVSGRGLRMCVRRPAGHEAAEAIRPQRDQFPALRLHIGRVPDAGRRLRGFRTRARMRPSRFSAWAASRIRRFR